MRIISRDCDEHSDAQVIIICKLLKLDLYRHILTKILLFLAVERNLLQAVVDKSKLIIAEPKVTILCTA